MIGNYVDLVTTHVGLNLGLSEKAPVAASFIEGGHDNNFYIVKVGIAALLIASAAIASETNSRYSFSLNKTVQITNLLVWGAVAVNTAQIVSQMK